MNYESPIQLDFKKRNMFKWFKREGTELSSVYIYIFLHHYLLLPCCHI